MNFQELITAVAVITKRPDQGDLITLKLQEATLWAHLEDFWRRDLQEKALTYTTPAFKGQILVDCDLPKLRKISYWRKFDPVHCCVGDYLKPVEPDNLIDEFSRQKINKYYLAGGVINWISSTCDKAHAIGYWAYPNINIAGYKSWIADEQPFILIHWAAAQVLISIGKKDEGNAELGLATTMMRILQTNEVESQGR